MRFHPSTVESTKSKAGAKISFLNEKFVYKVGDSAEDEISVGGPGKGFGVFVTLIQVS